MAARVVVRSLAAGVLVLLGFLAPARAEEPKRPWTDTANFSLISTSGNAKNTSFGLSNKYVYTWPKADFTFDAAALRVESTTRTPRDAGGFVVVDETSTTTAETYALGAKYRRTIHEKLYWYGLASWFKDEPSGIDSRARGGAGLGYYFLKSDVQTLAGEIGVNYTDEKQVSGFSDSFAELRGFLGYDRALSKTSKLNAELELMDNLDTTSDWRGNANVSVTASLSEKLALKAGYRVLYDNEPAEEPIPGSTLLFVHEKTDTIFAASLVVNF